LLFLLARLEIVEEFGSANKAALDNQATEMFFVLRRLSQDSFAIYCSPPDNGIKLVRNLN